MTPLHGPERGRAFCARLKAERERRGTSLRAIADSTKVKASLLEALERGDVSRWPKGIYRRSFFREYVASFGLPSEPYAAEFLELFPDGEEHPRTARPAEPSPVTPNDTPAPLRLTLAQDESGGWPMARGLGALAHLRVSPVHVLAALMDLGLVLLVGAALSALGITTFEIATGAAACGYYSIGTALAGRSLCSWALARRRRIMPVQPAVGRPVSNPTIRPASAATGSNLRSLVAQALRARSVIRASVVRLSGSPTLTGRTERRRELSQLRRRRVETANRATIDEAV